MGRIAAELAKRRRGMCRLSLLELNALLTAAGGTSRNGSRDLYTARRQLLAARERRRRAVQRASH